LAGGLLHYPLTEKSVHLCVDMQRLFTAQGWPTAWMERMLPVVVELAGRFPRRTVFTSFITPQRPDDMAGMWQRYYQRWRQATREHLDPGLLELLPPLASLCPPAAVIDKNSYSAFCGSQLLALA
jgi:nicotinamidase-related amidase